MRPKGDICNAMVKAWAQGPATVTQAAHRACVGVGAARYTASRMVSRGELVVVSEGRPAVLGVPETSVQAETSSADAYYRMLCTLGSMKTDL
jgi:hypothetical protein